MTQPLLTRDDVAHPRGLVLFLHGGKEHSLDPVTDRSNQWRRSRAMQRSVGSRLRAAGVSSWLLRYRVTGWNAGERDFGASVPDARWALDEVRRELGDLPVVLLGHSMGGRTAVHVADHPLVRGVVALAPWLPKGAPVDALAGRHVAAAHGSADRITSLRATERFVRRAEPVAASTEFQDMGRIGHYMLRRIRAWNDFAATRSLRIIDTQT